MSRIMKDLSATGLSGNLNFLLSDRVYLYILVKREGSRVKGLNVNPSSGIY